MITKKAITIEIIGESGTGKTDLVSRIPDSCLIDLTPSQESDVIFLKYHDDKYFDTHYFPCQSFDEILRAIHDLPEDTKTLAIDGSQYITDMAEVQWIKDQTKSREAALQREYGMLYSMVREKIIYPTIKRPRNLVFTSVLKDIFIDDKRTGRRERSGFKPFDVMRDVGILLYIDDNGMRQNIVAKNRFMPKSIVVNDIQIENPAYIKVLKPEASWESLIKMITAKGSAFKKEWLS